MVQKSAVQLISTVGKFAIRNWIVAITLAIQYVTMAPVHPVPCHLNLSLTVHAGKPLSRRW